MGNSQMQTQSQTQEYKLFMELQKQILHNQYEMQQEIHRINSNNNPFEQIKEQYKTIANCSNTVKHAFLTDILIKYNHLLTIEQVNKIKMILQKLEMNTQHQQQSPYSSFSQSSHPSQQQWPGNETIYNSPNVNTTSKYDNLNINDGGNWNGNTPTNTSANAQYEETYRNRYQKGKPDNQKRQEYMRTLESLREDPLQILGLNKNYTIEELKNAYKRMALKTHPDKCNGNDEKFKLVSKCYCKLLEDYKNREEYKSIDELRKHAKEYMGKQTDMPTNSILEDFAGEKKFNIKKFNEVFEKNKIYDPNDDGYDEWYKGADDSAATPPDLSNMFSKKFNVDLFNKTFNEHNTNTTQEICEYNEPSALVSCHGMAHSVLGARVDNFTSAMNNKLGFTDLKNAYTVDNKFINPDTVKKRKDYKNIDELVKEREDISFVLSPEEARRQKQKAQFEEEQEAIRLRRQEEYDRAIEEHYKRVSMAMLGVAKSPDLSR